MAVLGGGHGGAVVEQGGWRDGRWLFGGRGFGWGYWWREGSGGRKEGGEGDGGGRRGGEGAVVVASRDGGRERREGRRKNEGVGVAVGLGWWGGGGQRWLGWWCWKGAEREQKGGLGREEWGRAEGKVHVTGG
nr:ctenidin-1-like [Arachis hypogaea]